MSVKKIFCYSGTGNSLWTAKKIAANLEEAEVIRIPSENTGELSLFDYDIAGFVFPVHIWGVPAAVLKFIDTLEYFDPKYCFAVATNGGQVANTLVQLKKYLKEKKVYLNAGFSIVLPSNYIPWGGPGPDEKQQKLFTAAETRINEISAMVQKRRTQPVEKGPLWQRTLLSLAYKASVKHVNQMDSKFWVDESCNSCEICAKVCPANNISFSDGKPAWNQQCQQCYACLQWCPQEAIQYGKKTPKYQRYQHPEIKLKEMMTENFNNGESNDF